MVLVLYITQVQSQSSRSLTMCLQEIIPEYFANKWCSLYKWCFIRVIMSHYRKVKCMPSGSGCMAKPLSESETKKEKEKERVGVCVEEREWKRTDEWVDNLTVGFCTNEWMTEASWKKNCLTMRFKVNRRTADVIAGGFLSDGLCSEEGHRLDTFVESDRASGLRQSRRHVKRDRLLQVGCFSSKCEPRGRTSSFF